MHVSQVMSRESSQPHSPHMQVCTDGFTINFKQLKEGQAAHKGPGWFDCSLCNVTNSCDEGHAGARCEVPSATY